MSIYNYKSKYTFGEIVSILNPLKGVIDGIIFEDSKVFYNINILDNEGNVCSKLYHVDSALIKNQQALHRQTLHKYFSRRWQMLIEY